MEEMGLLISFILSVLFMIFKHIFLKRNKIREMSENSIKLYLSLFVEKLKKEVFNLFKSFLMFCLVKYL